MEELKEQMAMEAQMGADTQRKAKQVRTILQLYNYTTKYTPKWRS